MMTVFTDTIMGFLGIDLLVMTLADGAQYHDGLRIQISP
jgi:hypothetical protein